MECYLRPHPDPHKLYLNEILEFHSTDYGGLFEKSAFERLRIKQ